MTTIDHRQLLLCTQAAIDVFFLYVQLFVPCSVARLSLNYLKEIDVQEKENSLFAIVLGGMLHDTSLVSFWDAPEIIKLFLPEFEKSAFII